MQSQGWIVRAGRVAAVCGLVCGLRWSDARPIDAGFRPERVIVDLPTLSPPQMIVDVSSSTQAQTPIRKITLYRSGVGYFERAGTVTGDTQVQLRFPTEQINDILKSMVLLDLGGGKIEAVSYGSKEPLGRRLASFGVDISQNPSIPALLNQLRGASIKLTAAGETVGGTIIGVEERPVQLTKDAPAFMAPYVNILAGGGIRSVAVSSVTSFELLDKELASELEKALAALAEYRADRTKTVDVKFGAGGAAGERQVVIGYLHEMPVWKASYRLILPDETSPRAGDKARTMSLQGWAIVENNTDQDWEQVRLSLVSGRPVSFQMDLYEPLFVARPVVPVPTIPGVMPRAYQGGNQWDVLGSLQESRGTTGEPGKPGADEVPQIALRSLLRDSGPGGGGGQSPFQNDQDRGYGGVSAEEMADYAAAAAAQAGEIGEVFQYELDAPVTIERQKSAMLPIMSAGIAGRRVSIFNLNDGAEHPMRGVEITNDAGLQLLPGPIAVFDSSGEKSAYAGDAQIGHVAAGDKRLLAYAVDLDVDVLTETSSDSSVTRVRIVQGAFEVTSKAVDRATYGFHNKDAARGRTVIIEHPRSEGYTLVTPERASEVTPEFYRFEVSLEAGKTGTLATVEERVLSSTVGLLDTYTLDNVLAFRRDGRLSDSVLAAFRDAAGRRAAIQGEERKITEIDRQVGEIAKDQERIRGNIGQIDRSSQLYTRYMTKLTEQETQLESLAGSRKSTQEKLERMRAEFNEYLRGLNVE